MRDTQNGLAFATVARTPLSMDGTCAKGRPSPAAAYRGNRGDLGSISPGGGSAAGASGLMPETESGIVSAIAALASPSGTMCCARANHGLAAVYAESSPQNME